MRLDECCDKFEVLRHRRLGWWVWLTFHVVFENWKLLGRLGGIIWEFVIKMLSFESPSDRNFFFFVDVCISIRSKQKIW